MDSVYLRSGAKTNFFAFYTLFFDRVSDALLISSFMF